MIIYMPNKDAHKKPSSSLGVKTIIKAYMHAAIICLSLPLSVWITYPNMSIVHKIMGIVAALVITGIAVIITILTVKDAVEKTVAEYTTETTCNNNPQNSTKIFINHAVSDNCTFTATNKSMCFYDLILDIKSEIEHNKSNSDIALIALTGMMKVFNTIPEHRQNTNAQEEEMLHTIGQEYLDIASSRKNEREQNSSIALEQLAITDDTIIKMRNTSGTLGHTET